MEIAELIISLGRTNSPNVSLGVLLKRVYPYFHPWDSGPMKFCERSLVQRIYHILKNNILNRQGIIPKLIVYLNILMLYSVDCFRSKTREFNLDSLPHAYSYSKSLGKSDIMQDPMIRNTTLG